MWQYALVGSQVGLQFIGSHPRSKSSLPSLLADLVQHGIGTMQTELAVALQHPSFYSAYPTDILDPTHTIFVPRKLVFRLSKWCDHADKGETPARKFTRALFRHSNELRSIPPRFLDQENQPIDAHILTDFERWADGVVAAWGGSAVKGRAVTSALAAF